ncbi:transposase [Terrabacter tumescens]|uniref:transposase n=1 Tax=Terrabacter tumescens TaxID=60443 RepID=UPI001E533D39|nr:transposase [Terrabacter tumescens]
MPAKLSVRARVFATGQGRKTDATDAHSVALVDTRMAGLSPVVSDEQLEVLQLLVDRRRAMGEEHTRKISQLHRIRLEMLPGGAKTYLSAAQAKTLLTGVRPRDAVGKTRKRVAAVLVVDLERIHARKKAADKELKELVAATGTSLLDLHGVGPSGAARLLVEVGAWPGSRTATTLPPAGRPTGTAPIDASSGDHVRHRLSRGGNRQINRVLHIMATVQLRTATDGRAYFDRKKAAGKSSMEAMRCVNRRPSDLVFWAMLGDYTAGKVTGPGGHRGNVSDSSATGSQPHTGSSDKPLPGPATAQRRTRLPAVS